MKKLLIKSLAMSFLIANMFQITSSAATINENDKLIEYAPIEFNMDELNENSTVKSVVGKLVNREAQMECSGKTTVLGVTVSFKVIVEIPYTTYEEGSNRYIYSIDDDNIVSYLKSNNSLCDYEQGYIYSKISKDEKSAKILGYGTAYTSIAGVAYTSTTLDLSTTLYPTSGK